MRLACWFYTIFRMLQLPRRNDSGECGAFGPGHVLKRHVDVSRIATVERKKSRVGHLQYVPPD